MKKNFTVYSPASTANIGPGFDTFGCALNLYLKIKVVQQNNSENVNKNLNDYYQFIYKCIFYFYLRMTLHTPIDKAKFNSMDNKDFHPDNIPYNFNLIISNEIPVASGLGSSASVIVAAAVICNEIFELNLSKEELFEYILELEPHSDNVGACLFGSLFISLENKKGHVLQPHPDIRFLCITPDMPLKTNFSRSILPTEYSCSDVVYNLQHACSLVVSLTSKTLDVNKINMCLRDRLHQPYRIPYVSGFGEIMNSLTPDNTPGLLGIVLSGSGPSMLALCYNNVSQIAEKIKSMFVIYNVKVTWISLVPDHLGINIIYDD